MEILTDRDGNRCIYIECSETRGIVKLLPCDVATLVNFALANDVIRESPTGNFDHGTKDNNEDAGI